MNKVFVFGVWLIFLNPALLKQVWFHSKLSGVLVLIAYQIFAGVVRRKFSQGNFFLSERACRIINEVPTLLLIGIVIFAVTKPQL